MTEPRPVERSLAGRDPATTGLAASLRLPGSWLAAQIARPRPFGELWDDIDERWRRGLTTGRVPIGDAVTDLKRRVRWLESRAGGRARPLPAAAFAASENVHEPR